MVIFKRLCSKALGALQDHGEEGDGGNKNNYTNVSLRLCIITHINTVSHLLRSLSLSLSLSLSPPSTHTYTTHHTLTQSKLGKNEPIGFLEVKEIGFQSRLEASIVATSLI